MELNTSVLEGYRESMAEQWVSFVQEIIGTFMLDAPVLLNNLVEAYERDDVERFLRSAHSLKSNAAIFGACEFIQLAAELESMGLNHQIDAAGEKVKVLVESYPELERSLKRFHASL